MKKRIVLAAALVCLLAVVLCGAAYSKPTERFFVNDYANVLSSETENTMYERSAELFEKTEAQLVVLTTSTLGDMPAERYALEIGREWGIGDKKKNNGVLLLLAPESGDIRVEVGRGLEGALNDAKVGRMIDTYAMDPYRAGDFDTGTLELYNALLSQILEEYGLEGLEGYDADIPQESDSPDLWPLIMMLILFALFGGGGGFFFGRRRRRGPWNMFGGGFGPGGFGGGFGGFSGGGGFGGGGGFSGGGFSGGGGSFGGGGAGRKF